LFGHNLILADISRKRAACPPRRGGTQSIAGDRPLPAGPGNDWSSARESVAACR